MDTRLLLHTVLGLLLLLVPAGAIYLLDKKQLKTFGVAVARMAVQLLVLCLVVWGLMKLNNPWLLMVWLLAVTAYSAWLVLKRCKLEVGRLLPAVAAGVFVGTFVVGMWLLVLVLPVKAFDARWFVPVTALLTGHATAMMIRGLNVYVTALKADEQQYEFLRGNGLTHLKALQPFLRRALLAVISPTVANLTVLGLTSMPLLLCGIFLGGMTPINAFVVMLQMTIGCVAVSVLSLGITLAIADRVLFDSFGKLK